MTDEKIDGRVNNGAPYGNTNARRGREWRDAIAWALEHYEQEGAIDKVVSKKKALYKIAMKLVATAVMEHQLGGEAPTFKELMQLDSTWRFSVEEIGNRLDGKATQPIAGDDEHPPITVLGVEFIKPDAKG